MNIFKCIGLVVTGIVFLLSTSGILVYHSFCACTGSEEVSLWVEPETCHSQQHEDNNCHIPEIECNSCKSNSGHCKCPVPEKTFYVLTNPFIQLNHNDTNLRSVQPVEIHCFDLQQQLEDDSLQEKGFYIDPPPIKESSAELLISICQLRLHCVS